MSKKIYSFLVGIDNYPDPKDNLNGAVADTKKIEKFLRDNVAEDVLQLKILHNEQATYKNFIAGFREHLGNAGSDDVVWFHYSGHGSRQRTAQELEPYTSGKMDETLVLVDSRPDGYDLADKELGLLIDEVAKKGAHIIVSLDCCHSGAGTRDMDGPAPDYKVRMAGDRKDGRSLESYMDGHFVRNGLNFPDPRHILLAACNRFQTAKETFSHSGIFTQNLINTLNKTGTNISYADLFVRLRQGVINNNVPDQDPQIELIGGSNGYIRFLDGVPMGGIKRFPVYKDKTSKEWVMSAGAIQGFQNAAAVKTEVNIFLEDSTEPFTSAVITAVSFQKSVLQLQAELSTDKRYWAIPKNFPNPPEKIYFENGIDKYQGIQKELEDFPQVHVAQEDEKAIASFTMKETPAGLELWENNRQIIIQKADKSDETGSLKLLMLLDQVITWQRINSLQNQHSRIRPIDTLIDMEIVENGVPVCYGPGVIQLKNNGADYPYKIMVQNKMKQPLHYCLLYLSDNYGVMVLKNEPIEGSDEPTLFWGGGDEDFFHPDEGGAPSNDTLMIIVSTERTDDFELQMDGIELGKTLTSHRGIAGINKYVPLKGEWFTQKFNVRIS